MERIDVQTCELFDFMSDVVGISVLHPGGYEATDKLINMCNISENSHILDLACGKGTTAIYLAKKFGCRVTGIDISEKLIETAKQISRQKRMGDKITFKVANALEMPFEDDLFDSVVSQAFFILIDENERALEEISRVLKPGGTFGALELSWFKRPPEDIYEEIVKTMCGKLITRVMAFEEWDAFFQSKQMKPISVIKNIMSSSMIDTFKTEGFSNALNIMLKTTLHSDIRNRMMTMRKTFTKYSDYLGYGIYGYKKQHSH